MANLALIRELCEQKKITIRELAQRIGRDESTIQGAMRRGSSNSGTIEAIAEVLGVSAGVFFDGYTENSSSDMAKEIEYLRQLLSEKERLIEVLMEKTKGKDGE